MSSAQGHGRSVSQLPDARRHREQVAQGDAFEPGIPRRQLGEVVAHRVLDAPDEPLVDGIPTSVDTKDFARENEVCKVCRSVPSK